MNASAMVALLPHMLRPLWLMALLALPLLWWLGRRHAKRETPWRHAVDPHLLPSLLQAAPAATGRMPWLLATAYALSVFALAGPSWRQQPAPLYTAFAPLVVVMDASSHMLATDQPPSRLLRERLKIEQLIAARKGGQIGLVAYAGDAFTVAPLSDDANNLLDLLAALAPDAMPVDGQRADRGITHAIDLLKQAGYPHGQILVFSDGADFAAQAAARDAAAKGYSVDAIGVGTANGAPLPALDGTFAQDADGAIRIARLDADALRSLAQAGNGRYSALKADKSDLIALGVLDSRGTGAAHRDNADSLRWRDDGPFLVLALLPLVALGFRRGWLSIVLLALLAMPAQRASAADANWWNALWQRADQRADHALRSGDAATASALAQTADQRAAAAYRSGNFAAASHDWMQRNDADANYNRGNALANMQQYPQAIDAYRRALRQRPGMKDAQDNLKIVEQLLKKKQEEDNQQQDEQQQNQQQQQQQQQQQNQQQGQKELHQNGQSKNQENMQKSQKQGQQQNQEQNRQLNQQQGQGQEQQKQRQQEQQDQQGKEQQQDQAQQQTAPDRKKQEQADAAEQRALQQALRDHEKVDQSAHDAKGVKESTPQREQREATEALMQRVPDDPGGLLRRKFALEYARRQQEGEK